ncbi:ATP-binding protein [Halosquirtibacter laminarini]|uniref:ATP-binding protein n=1 Tax=Halosquirtibacter laminarini TaxID=3374600 RepID=A0AC61NCS1_9BACT|nr:ATP-binding protein [Prolixibacteraceae bacterium]
MLRVVVTGAESVGKSTISEMLAKYFQGTNIPEYARTYVEEHGYTYQYDDVVAIAKYQVEEDLEIEQLSDSIVFYDSWLIITKVWLFEMYKQMPDFVDAHIADHKADLYLLLTPDLPWVEDPVRENGGEMRWKLHQKYKEELEHYQCNYVEVSEVGEDRFLRAKSEVEKLLRINTD